MVRIEGDVARNAVAMDQQQDLSVLGDGTLPTRKDDLPHVQSHLRIEVVLGVEQLIAGVADEIIGYPKAIGILRYCSLEPRERGSQSESQKKSYSVEIFDLHVEIFPMVCC